MARLKNHPHPDNGFRRGSTPLPGPVFAEPVIEPDPSRPEEVHPSDNRLYATLKEALKHDAVGFEKSRIGKNDVFALESVLGSDAVKTIKNQGRIVFHAAGDTGASNVRRYRDEIRVADQVSDDFHTSSGASRPTFFYHLGGVVYNFGEARYYFDQFYEPFRNYPGPIFAIPGNHDSFVVPGTAAEDRPLTTFMRNFCAPEPIITPEAGSLHRTAMTQPGVYFTLDAPFVRIIGLFSNALEDPGVISSQDGHFPDVPDLQLKFLEAQLERIRQENYAGAVLLAMHHPPFTYAPSKTGRGTGGNHGSSLAMLRQIDAICAKVGVYPHAILSGHAHNYQRYTRTVRMNGQSYDVPFIICGDGGHNVSPVVHGHKGEHPREPDPGTDVKYLDVNPAVDSGGLLLEWLNDHDFGYLRIGADAQQLQIGFHVVASGRLSQSRVDMVTVQLDNHTMVSN